MLKNADVSKPRRRRKQNLKCLAGKCPELTSLDLSFSEVASVKCPLLTAETVFNFILCNNNKGEQEMPPVCVGVCVSVCVYASFGVLLLI